MDIVIGVAQAVTGASGRADKPSFVLASGRFRIRNVH